MKIVEQGKRDQGLKGRDHPWLELIIPNITVAFDSIIKLVIYMDAHTWKKKNQKKKDSSKFFSILVICIHIAHYLHITYTLHPCPPTADP